ncbi:MAG: hypothetical protein AAB444_03740 [Patescibacteria group bacterium]
MLPQQNNLWYTKPRDGYATLMSVLIVGAIGIAIATSLLLLGVGFLRTSFAGDQSGGARALANSCAEEGLRQIRNASSFTGTGNLTLGQGTCSYTVTSQGGENRTVITSGLVNTITRKVKVIINAINPSIQTVSWQEVADF